MLFCSAFLETRLSRREFQSSSDKRQLDVHLPVVLESAAISSKSLEEGYEEGKTARIRITTQDLLFEGDIGLLSSCVITINWKFFKCFILSIKLINATAISQKSQRTCGETYLASAPASAVMLSTSRFVVGSSNANTPHCCANCEKRIRPSSLSYKPCRTTYRVR
jgi:hypothetical protein